VLNGVGGLCVVYLSLCVVVSNSQQLLIELLAKTDSQRS